MEPFAIRVADRDLDDLADRLTRTRWPAELPPGWDRGTDPVYLRRMVQRWQEGFDWRAQEREINRFAQFMADVEDVRVHFVHVRGRGPDPLPLVLSHGWPSSFLEFLPVVSLLTDPAAHGADPADAFDVVVPSLPGFGFTSGPPGRGIIRLTPSLWVRLMTDVLGYPRFGAHGTDIGAFVTNRLALEHREAVIGAHVTLLAEPWQGAGAPPMDEDEQAWIAARELAHEASQAYAHLQRTTPTTIGYALHDSPVALAAWIAEKWPAWSDCDCDCDCDCDLERRFSAEQLLTTVTLYWLTATATSSMHAYADLALATAAVPDHQALYPDAPPGADGNALPAGRRIDAPVGVLRTAGYNPPRRWAERVYSDLRHWTRAPRGGHFLAMEQPDLLVDDLREFFRPLRTT